MLPLDISQVAGIEGAGHAFSILKRSPTEFPYTLKYSKVFYCQMQLPCLGLRLILVYLFGAAVAVDVWDRSTR